MAHKPKLIILTGATAAGKSAFIYQHLLGLPLTIINADSRQIYRGITIASAAPQGDDLTKFPHVLFNFLKPDESFSAGAFMRAAKAEIDKAQSRGHVPLVCGGTYFYLHALLYGLLPPVDVSDEIRGRVEAMSLAAAFAMLQELDGAAAEANHPHNGVRVRRAVMLCLALGGPISALEKSGGVADDLDILMLIFDMSRDALRLRTAERVRQMMAAGLVSEIDALLSNAQGAGHIADWRQIPAFTGIGIREFLEIYEVSGKLPRELSLEELKFVENSIATNTIRLVKRQQTWYKNATPKPANTKTVDPSYENELIAALVREFAS